MFYVYYQKFLFVEYFWYNGCSKILMCIWNLYKLEITFGGMLFIAIFLLHFNICNYDLNKKVTQCPTQCGSEFLCHPKCILNHIIICYSKYSNYGEDSSSPNVALTSNKKRKKSGSTLFFQFSRSNWCYFISVSNINYFPITKVGLIGRSNLYLRGSWFRNTGDWYNRPPCRWWVWVCPFNLPN